MSLRHFKKPILWTYHPFVLETHKCFAFSKLVYHCVDDLSAVPGIDPMAFKLTERALVEKCDAIFNTSLHLQTMMAALAPGRSHYFNNVADIERFSQARNLKDIPKELTHIPTPRLGYVGVISDFKVDFQLILAIAKKRQDWHWVFIGDEREGQVDATLEELKRLPNVHLLGYRKYDEIPQHLAGLDVAVLPTLINDYTRSMFPMKFFEYLAAGLPVVSTPLPALMEHQNLFRSGATAAEFEQALAQTLALPKADRAVKLEAISRENWETRLDRMLAILDS